MQNIITKLHLPTPSNRKGIAISIVSILGCCLRVKESTTSFYVFDSSIRIPSQAVLDCKFREPQVATLIALADRLFVSKVSLPFIMPRSSRSYSTRSGSSRDSDRSRERKPDPTCEECRGKGWYKMSIEEVTRASCNVCRGRCWVYCCQGPSIWCPYCHNGPPRKIDCSRCEGDGYITVVKTRYVDERCGCAY